jgi:hypothetical protein
MIQIKLLRETGGLAAMLLNITGVLGCEGVVEQVAVDVSEERSAFIFTGRAV